MSSELRVLPVEGMPEVREGDRVGQLIAERAQLEDGDVVVISQKIVSKAEGRVRRLSEVAPSERARELAERLGKEAGLVELVLSESRAVLRSERVLITETHHGFVCANAGIDSSNLPEDGTVCLLPKNPDASARQIRTEISAPPGRGRNYGQFRKGMATGTSRGSYRVCRAATAGRLAWPPRCERAGTERDADRDR